MPKRTFRQVSAIIIFLLCIVIISRWIPREQFTSLLLTYLVSFAAYVVIVLDFAKGLWKKNGYLYLLGMGIVLRMSLLGVTPQLSDDIWRFLWDGQLLAHYINPFHFTPNDIMASHPSADGLSLQGLYEKLNSPEYYSVYPPVNQLVFALGAALFPTSESGQIVWIQVFLLACEVGTIALLYRHVGKLSAVLYALNPLVILEIVGNCHFEGAMIFCLIASLVALRQRNHITSALWWSLAVCSKILPLMFLPIVLAKMSKKQAFWFLSIVTAGSVFLFSPFFDIYFVEHISNSLNLYFSRFEFNASLYYLTKGSEYALKGYNEFRFFGAILSVVVILGIILLANKVYRRIYSLEIALLKAAILHLLFASVVHPWYITVPFALACFALKPHAENMPYDTSKKIFSLLPLSIILAILWTGLVFISYSHYSNGYFHEHYSHIALEYGVLLCIAQLWSSLE